MLYALLVAGAVACAVQAIRSTRLLTAALWLAGVSALTAIMLFRMGAHEVAVIELSVGAGLVTVLFVFAINIAGDDALDAQAILPVPLVLGVLLLLVAALVVMVLPVEGQQAAASEAAFGTVLWNDRALDVLLQLVLIFAGVLCLLGVLSESKIPARHQDAAALRSELAESAGSPDGVDDTFEPGEAEPALEGAVLEEVR